MFEDDRYFPTILGNIDCDVIQRDITLLSLVHISLVFSGISTALWTTHFVGKPQLHNSRGPEGLMASAARTTVRPTTVFLVCIYVQTVLVLVVLLLPGARHIVDRFFLVTPRPDGRQLLASAIM